MMLNTALFITGFSLGTFKFLFAHWLTLGAAKGLDYEPHFYEIFLSTTAGAWVSLTVFYWASGWLMKKAAQKRKAKRKAALDSGEVIVRKRVFTRINVFIVWVKMKIGIYGITLLAPLFLSIPIGSIVCAKFYGHRRRTYPLMLIFTGSYSFLMCLWIYFQV